MTKHDERVAAYLDGSLTESQAEELAAHLRDDSDAIRSFVRDCCIESQLFDLLEDECRGVDVLASLELTSEASDAEAESSASVTSADDLTDVHLSRPKSWLDHASRHPMWPAIAVATIGVVALVLLAALTPVGNFFAAGDDGKHEELEPREAKEIATLTGWHRIDWKEGYHISGQNHRLWAGQRVAMLSGLAEITYDTGAKVLLEGPCEFLVGDRGQEAGGDDQEGSNRGRNAADVISANGGYLELGRLVARCDTVDSQGFTISTPVVRVEDRGTEFGVEADVSGVSVVEVFDGKVEARRTHTTTRRAEAVILTAGQSARLEPNDAQILRQERLSGRFVRNLREKAATDVSLSATNWRTINMYGVEPGSESMSVYAVHESREENAILSFDVSSYHGATAAGPGTITFTISGVSRGIQTAGKFELELRQMNQHNAAVDLDAASTTYLDGSSQRWRNNAGEEMENLGRANSVVDITSSLIASQTGPFGGDTPTTDAAAGTKVVLTIPQATLQSWLDQTAPPIVVLCAHTRTVVHMKKGVSHADPMVDYCHFGTGTTQPLPLLRFDIRDRPNQSSHPLSPAPSGNTANP